jgi:RNA polymerase sigma factor (sigma-70 family)
MAAKPRGTTMHASIPDTQLLDRWRTRRDADAFAELVSRYGPLVYSACLRVLRCRTAAEDAAQDCFVELFQSRARVRSLPSYLHVTATHRALDRLKAEKRRGVRESRFAAARPETVQPDWDDLSAAVDEAIAHLPEKLRLPVVMRFLQGRTYVEIASEAGLPVSTVQYRVNQGIEGIRGHLAKRGLVVGASALATMLAAAPSHALPGAAAAKLGTLALAGGGTAAFSTIAISTLGGIFAMKLIVATLVILGAAALTATLLLESDSPETASSAAPTPLPLEMAEAEPTPTTASALPEPAIVAPEPSPALDNAETPKPTLGSMAGRVFTIEGEPLAEWTVMAKYEDHQAQVLTDEKGEFLLKDLPPGDYVVTAEHPRTGRRAELDRDSIPLLVSEAITGLEAVWQTGPLTLSGYVTRDDGAPAAGIVVSTYYAFESTKGQEVQQLETKTDEDGRYTLSGFPDVPALSVNVEIDVEHCFHIDRSSIVLDGHEEDFVLERAPAISGWVRDAETRDPVTAFRLSHWPVDAADLAPEKEESAISVHRQELTNYEDGAFSIQARGYESIRFTVAAPGYLTAVKTLTGVKPGAVVEGMEILLQPAKPLSGVVVNEAGEGIAGARIYLGHPEYADPSSGFSILGAEGVTTTDSAGAFTLSEYPPTLSIVSAQQKGYAVAWADASVTSPIRITLTRGATVEGVVNLDGAPVSDRRAGISIGHGFTTIVSARAGEDGSFRVENAPTGTLSISASLSVDGLTPRIEREVNLASGETYNLNFDFDTQSGAFLEGVVLVDDEPLETARLIAKTTLANGDRVTYWIDAQSDGTYRLGPVLAGAYEFGPLGIPMRNRATRFPDPEAVTLQEGETVKLDLLYTSR